MTGVVLVCPNCESAWRQLADEEHSRTAVVLCPSCGQSATFLEAAAAAWALDHITHAEFFAIAGQVAPEEVDLALAALVNIAAWWERRTADRAAGRGDPRRADDATDPG